MRPFTTEQNCDKNINGALADSFKSLEVSSNATKMSTSNEGLDEEMFKPNKEESEPSMQNVKKDVAKAESDSNFNILKFNMGNKAGGKSKCIIKKIEIKSLNAERILTAFDSLKI